MPAATPVRPSSRHPTDGGDDDEEEDWYGAHGGRRRFYGRDSREAAQSALGQNDECSCDVVAMRLSSALALAAGVLLPAALCALIAATTQIPSTSWVSLTGTEAQAQRFLAGTVYIPLMVAAVLPAMSKTVSR